MSTIGQEALQPNPALEPFRVLLGTWNTIGTHPLVPGKTFHGRHLFEWTEGGAFLRMRSEIDEPEIPSAVAFIGTDDGTSACTMLYFDERKVSRHYQVRMEGNTLKWWRDASDFAQRFTGTLSADGRTMVGQGEMRRDGGAWEPDLQLTFTRTAP